jgi:hypothetical protein
MRLEVDVPSSLSEIPLKNYQEFVSVVKNNEDEDFINQKMIEIFCGISLADVVKMKLSSVVELKNHFNKIFSEKGNLKTIFKIGEIEFGFIPDLENINFGEYIDLDKYINNFDTMHKAMAVMYRPIKKQKGNRYEIEDYKGTKEYADLMKYAPLDVVLPASVFFWNLGKELCEATLIYLEREATKMILAKKRSLQLNGVGIQAYINSQREMLQELEKLQNKGYLPV